MNGYLQEEYVWENDKYINKIGISPAIDCCIIQIDKKRNKENRVFGKREMMWTPLTAIAIKYASKVNKEALKKIREQERYKELAGKNGDKEVITSFMEKEIFEWDKEINIDDFPLNNLIEDFYIFIKEKNLYIMKAIKTPALEGLKDIKRRDEFFELYIEYFPSDAYNLLEAILLKSPYDHELPFAIENFFLNEN